MKDEGQLAMETFRFIFHPSSFILWRPIPCCLVTGRFLPAWVILLVAIAGLVFACWHRPQIFFVRLPLWIIMHTVYRVKTLGLENVPAEGPVLRLQSRQLPRLSLRVGGTKASRTLFDVCPLRTYTCLGAHAPLVRGHTS